MTRMTCEAPELEGLNGFFIANQSSEVDCRELFPTKISLSEKERTYRSNFEADRENGGMKDGFSLARALANRDAETKEESSPICIALSQKPMSQGLSYYRKKRRKNKEKEKRKGPQRTPSGPGT